MFAEAKKNKLVAALPHDTWLRWQSQLEWVDLAAGQVLFEPGKTPVEVYFPTTAVVSLLYVMRNGASAQVASVGNDGMAHIWSVVDAKPAPGRCLVQTAGKGLRLPARAVSSELERGGNITRLLLRYALAFLAQVAQTAACYRIHALEQQLCRWLLHTLDRLEGHTLLTTHELIANMLGVRRESVTEAAQKLQALGLIHTSRGRIVVLDRPGLEQRSCECYRAVRREYDNLLPSSVLS